MARASTSSRRHVPDAAWTFGLFVATVAAWGLLTALADTRAWPYAIQLGVAGSGMAGGLLARRAIDAGATGLGLVAFFVLRALGTVIERGYPLSDIPAIAGSTVVAALFVALVSLIGLVLRAGLRHVGLRPLPARLGVVVVAYAALTWLYIGAAARDVPSHSFRLVDQQTIVLTVTGGPGSWCRLADLRETDAEVTVRATCVELQLFPSTAVGVPIDLTVHLARPLGERRVLNASGVVMRQSPPPVTTITQERAAAIALDTLLRERPGIRPDATKLLDLFLDKDPAGHVAWKAYIIVLEEPPSSPDPSRGPTGIWMWIDAESGAVTIISRE